MPRDPLLDFFFGDRNRDSSENNRNRNDDPFMDPFFRHFSDMSKHMDEVFEEFFNHSMPNDSSNPRNNESTIIINRSPNMDNTPRNDRPHLSQINPSITTSPESDNNNNNNNNNNDFMIERRSRPDSNFDDPFRMFRDFFEPLGRAQSRQPPEYQQPSLSDINPEFNNGNNSPIINDKNKDSNLVHPNGPPPGFRSPYLPNWNGAEKSIENENENDNGNMQRYFRSQSVVISTTPDGKTRKITTIRDENGNIEESTEMFDNMDDATGGNNGNFGIDFGFPRRMLDFGFRFPNSNENNDEKMPSLRDDIINNDNNSNNNSVSPWLARPNDPFGRWRQTIDDWKARTKEYWFGNRNNRSNGTTQGYEAYDRRNSNNNNSNEWFCPYRKNNSNNQNNLSNDGNKRQPQPSKIEWKSNHRNYRRNNNNDASRLRDQIIKNPINNDDE